MPPTGWSAVGSVAVTKGSDTRGVCVTTQMLYWAGLVHPAPSAGANYTVTVEGRLQPGTLGWGVAARASVSAASAVGHAVQYDSGIDGFRDVDYPPSDIGPTYAHLNDAGWHLAAIVVQGSTYTQTIDGVQIARREPCRKPPKVAAARSSGSGRDLRSRFAYPTITPN